MTILHTADLHLGQILYQYYARVDEHGHFFSQLQQWCHEYRPDALLVCGDVFDIPQPGAATKEYFNHTFVQLHRLFPDMAIIITAGNHDSPSRLEADSPVWGLSGVTLIGHAPASDVMLQEENWQQRFVVEIPSGYIIALPFMTSSRPEVLQSLLDYVAEHNVDNKPVVMTGHLAVSGGDFTGHDDIGTIKSVSPDQLGSGFDYLALGHIHRPQTIGHPISDENKPQSCYPSGTIRYSGAPLHVSCDEQYPHTVSIVDIERHDGPVTVTRLHIDELRHFFTLPGSDKEAATSETEVMQLVNDFCRTHERGYIRLRIDYNAPMPPNYIQAIYHRLEATGNEVRLNPKTIWENQKGQDEDKKKLVFEVAELQQMTNPMEFIRKTIDHYPTLKLEDLEDDFKEIEAEIVTINNC